MPIAENFPEGLTPTGKINLDDGNFHIMWGPGKKTNTDGSQAEVFADSDVVAAYAAEPPQLLIFKLLPKAPAYLAVYSPTAAEPSL